MSRLQAADRVVGASKPSATPLIHINSHAPTAHLRTLVFLFHQLPLKWGAIITASYHAFSTGFQPFYYATTPKNGITANVYFADG